MKRLLFYILITLAFISRAINQSLYMSLIILAHRSQGVKFIDRPEYIHQDAYLDPSGGLTIDKGVVISTKVIILTHDWSFLKRITTNESTNAKIPTSAFREVYIKRNSFIGAGAIILPGTNIGENCIIGAGAVVKGIIEDGSIMIGNPAQKLERNENSPCA